ncbi:hypothetical protein PIB30_068532, partial [Stylosanthes scabra]|nr:hypothetical protein [Stylosanthes scabra]
MSASSSNDRKANNNLRLDEVLVCLSVEGAQWVRHFDGRPYFLRRTDLQPMARGWYEFVCKSIMPTTNRCEVNVEREVLIHATIIGNDIQVDEIIAEQMYKFVNKTNTRSKLPFPSVIALLCKEAKVTDSPKTFSFLYKRATPASGPDQVVSLYEWIS